MLRTLYNRKGQLVGLVCLGVMAAVPAYATSAIDLTPVATDISDTITANKTIVLGVLGIMMGAPLAKRFLKRMSS
jgi:hypothetical protein